MTLFDFDLWTALFFGFEIAALLVRRADAKLDGFDVSDVRAGGGRMGATSCSSSDAFRLRVLGMHYQHKSQTSAKCQQQDILRTDRNVVVLTLPTRSLIIQHFALHFPASGFCVSQIARYNQRWVLEIQDTPSVALLACGCIRLRENSRWVVSKTMSRNR